MSNMDSIKVKQEPSISGGNRKRKVSSTPVDEAKDNKYSSTSAPKKQNKLVNHTPITIKKENFKDQNSTLKRKQYKATHNSSNGSSSSCSGGDVNNNGSVKSFKVKEKQRGFKEMSNKDKNKMLEFMIDVPEIADAMNNDDSSKFSSPFNSRVDTAGTNLTFLTKGHTEGDDFNNNYKGGANKLKTHVNANMNSNVLNPGTSVQNDSTHLPGLQFRDSSEVVDSGDNLSFLSSPCVERKKRKVFENEIEGSGAKKQKTNIFNIGIGKGEKVKDRNDSYDSNIATDGSAEASMNDNSDIRPLTPKKYQIDEVPTYEYMEGEDQMYYEIMGKNKETEELDDNEKQFFNFVHMNFEQWSEQSILFVKEYESLMRRVMLARLKFNKRIKFLKNNLDEFALNLEKYGIEINKRGEILKEYCSKIVNEME